MGLRVGRLLFSLYFWCVDWSCVDWIKKWGWIRLRNEVMRGWIELRNEGGSDWEMSYMDRTEKWKRETHRAWKGLAAWRRGSWAFGMREMVELDVIELGEHLLLQVHVRELRQKLFEVKMRTEMVLHLGCLILRSTLKIFSVWPNFSDQPNSLFYGKVFLKLVWSQNKHSHSCSHGFKNRIGLVWTVQLGTEYWSSLVKTLKLVKINQKQLKLVKNRVELGTGGKNSFCPDPVFVLIRFLKPWLQPTSPLMTNTLGKEFFWRTDLDCYWPSSQPPKYWTYEEVQQIYCFVMGSLNLKLSSC